MSLFVALWPNVPVRDALTDWQAVIPQGGRLVHPDDLHLTLAFLGPTPADRLPAVREAINAVRAEALVLRLDRLNYWRHNRIVWAGMNEVPTALETLARRTREALAARDVHIDEQDFVPHITLARNAKASDSEAPKQIRWQADQLVLARSVGGSAPRYRVEFERSLD